MFGIQLLERFIQYDNVSNFADYGILSVTTARECRVWVFLCEWWQPIDFPLVCNATTNRIPYSVCLFFLPPYEKSCIQLMSGSSRKKNTDGAENFDLK
jgi:hypothetical protein